MLKNIFVQDNFLSHYANVTIAHHASHTKKGFKDAKLIVFRL